MPRRKFDYSKADVDEDSSPSDSEEASEKLSQQLDQTEVPGSTGMAQVPQLAAPNPPAGAVPVVPNPGCVSYAIPMALPGQPVVQMPTPQQLMPFPQVAQYTAGYHIQPSVVPGNQQQQQQQPMVQVLHPQQPQVLHSPQQPHVLHSPQQPQNVFQSSFCPQIRPVPSMQAFVLGSQMQWQHIINRRPVRDRLGTGMRVVFERLGQPQARHHQMAAHYDQEAEETRHENGDQRRFKKRNWSFSDCQNALGDQERVTPDPAILEQRAETYSNVSTLKKRAKRFHETCSPLLLNIKEAEIKKSRSEKFGTSKEK